MSEPAITFPLPGYWLTFHCSIEHFTQSNRHTHTEGLKYSDN